MGEVHGPYPTLDTAAQDNYSPQTSDDAHTTPQTQATVRGDKLRRHAACDECRERKLKCSGEPTGCSRCVKRGIPCVYSQQKQMGRPRKRQKMDEEIHDVEIHEARPSTVPPRTIQPQPYAEFPPETPIDPSLSNIDQDLTNFHNVCTAPIAQTIRSQRTVDAFSKQFASDSQSVFQSDDDAQISSQSYTHYPQDISQWPDFSTIETLPLPLTTKWSPGSTSPTSYTSPPSTTITHANTLYSYQDPDVDPSALASLPSVPACPCLPNLYLALSTLSTLSSFPVSQQSFDSLLAAQKTAHSVIYCPVCPRQYQSGSQNLMLGCTLLNVLADHWHRIRNTNPEDLKRGFFALPPNTNGTALTSSSPTSQPQLFISVKEGNAWRKFIRQTIRAYVFGDAAIPKPPSDPIPPSTSALLHEPSNTINNTSTSANEPGPKVPESNTLTSLISALERRQRQWHQLDDPTDEFPDRMACEHGPARGPHIHEHGRGHTTQARTEAHGGGDDANADGEDGRRNGDGNSHKRESQDRNGHTHDSDHRFLCLMIVRPSKDIVEELDKDGH